MAGSGRRPMNSARKKRVRSKFVARDPRCHYCRKPVCNNSSTIDHVVPRSQGGTNEQGNLVLCCFDCNNEKGSQSYLAFFNRKVGTWKI